MMKNTRQERQADTRKAILQTALELIAEKGLDKLSLREIARRVGYSPAGLYEYFDSKEGILLTLAEEGDGWLRKAALNIPAELPALERLIQACLAYVDFAIHNAEHFIIMNSLTTGRASLDEPASSESSYTAFLRIIQAAMDEGDISAQGNFGAEEITYGLWALIHGIGILRLTQLRNFEADFETMNRKVIETFIKGLK
ncbi:MAG: TetR/AcrR family transcriptional regulator [Anaerolineae bacterium]|jgi:AcrR family transcriptional regulator|nr:TetR/AcrR family transcriptional regulator [Anaerolineae bacterium]MBT7075011.1 TetR/AcrR family transcriptional regulator [Anaerolineae bacterium]MBT7782948.1 TetR/AcrR family transcriptional regulator [Anaerolineae bacterium]